MYFQRWIYGSFLVICSFSFSLAQAILDLLSMAAPEMIPELVENLARNIDHLPSRFILHRPILPASTPCLAHIPLIDLSGLQDPLLRPLTLSQIHHACAHWGIFQAIHHGIPEAVLQKLQQEVANFFKLPMDERNPTAAGNQGQGYGSGFVRPETGVTEWRDFCRLLTYPESARDYSVWPKSPPFREAIEKYSKEARTLIQKMLACSSENLGLRPSYVEEALGETGQRLLINHYPPCPEPTLAAGIGEHTDVGAMTCLWQSEDVVGLQVLKDGDWVPVRPVAGSLMIIVADQLEIVSNGIYKSVHHRAVVNAESPRISIVAFCYLKPDTVVRPAQELIGAEHPALYRPTRFGDHALKLANPHTFAERKTRDD